MLIVNLFTGHKINVNTLQQTYLNKRKVPVYMLLVNLFTGQKFNV